MAGTVRKGRGLSGDSPVRVLTSSQIQFWTANPLPRTWLTLSEKEELWLVIHHSALATEVHISVKRHKLGLIISDSRMSASIETFCHLKHGFVLINTNTNQSSFADYFIKFVSRINKINNAVPLTSALSITRTLCNIKHGYVLHVQVLTFQSGFVDFCSIY